MQNSANFLLAVISLGSCESRNDAVVFSLSKGSRYS